MMPQILVSVTLIALGLAALYGATMNADWLLDRRYALITLENFGRDHERVLHGISGGIIVFLGLQMLTLSLA